MLLYMHEWAVLGLPCEMRFGQQHPPECIAGSHLLWMPLLLGQGQGLFTFVLSKTFVLFQDRGSIVCTQGTKALNSNKCLAGVPWALIFGDIMTQLLSADDH